MSTPNINFFILSGWGFPDEGESFYAAGGSGLVFGTNPPYQISDFLQVYPKFGQYAQAVSAYTLSNIGSGYLDGDTITPTQADASGAVITVTAVSSVDGSITGSVLTSGGTGYSLASGLPTTTSGLGTGAVVNVIGIVPANLIIPQVVLQLYINLASACINQTMWLSMWPMAMALFIAHYCTLYLLSDGTPVSSAGQAAQQGLARGIAVSKSAGDVSVSYETVTQELQKFGAWNRTEYGQLLATMASTIGMGPLFLW